MPAAPKPPKTPALVGKRADVIRLRQANPCWHGVQIAGALGLSKERVRQILAQEGLLTKRYSPQYQCLNCDTVFRPGNYSSIKFCSVACSKAYQDITLICEVCGTSFKRRQVDYIWNVNHPHPLTGRPYDHTFCSRHCWGVWFGKNHKPATTHLFKTHCVREHLSAQEMGVGPQAPIPPGSLRGGSP